ncbi:hypothetical protein I4U23_012152 [Adineta vaga]|nr:hypothetical protein I4U23_012152 [Adineta vaga]
MLRHRKRISPTSKTIQNIRRILRKHRDFFLPLIATAICSIPMIVIYESMTCAKASKVNSLPYLMLIFGQIFSILPTSFSFFGYVYLPNVYRTAFWEKSLVGKSLTKLKQFITNRYQNFKIVFNKADSSVTVVSSTIH